MYFMKQCHTSIQAEFFFLKKESWKWTAFQMRDKDVFLYIIVFFSMVDTKEDEKRRFQIELEFIQCLSNPWYLNSMFYLSLSHTIS